jgi:deoxyribodipyrimidine photolyase
MFRSAQYALRVSHHAIRRLFSPSIQHKKFNKKKTFPKKWLDLHGFTQISFYDNDESSLP